MCLSVVCFCLIFSFTSPGGLPDEFEENDLVGGRGAFVLQVPPVAIVLCGD